MFSPPFRSQMFFHLLNEPSAAGGRLGQKMQPAKSGGSVPAYNNLGRSTDLTCIFRPLAKKRRQLVKPLGIMHWLVAIPVITARRKKAYAPLIKSPP